MRIIWHYIKKFWYIGLLVVLYLIVDISGIVPEFGLFRRGAFQLRDTPVIVKEIKKINQLFAAEYYGEVYGDLYEGYEQLLHTRLDTAAVTSKLYKKYPRLKRYEELKSRIISLKEQDSIYNARADSLVKSNKNRKVKRLQEKIKDLHEEMQKAREELISMKKERNLVYIGRGWVKAGFDFGRMDAGRFEISHKADTATLAIPEPKILDTDINPWFIPNEVKGYELFMHQSDREPFTNKEIVLVKTICKKKLRESALEKGIMEKARESGKTTLSGFFKLLDFEDVKIRFK